MTTAIEAMHEVVNQFAQSKLRAIDTRFLQAVEMLGADVRNIDALKGRFFIEEHRPPSMLVLGVKTTRYKIRPLPVPSHGQEAWFDITEDHGTLDAPRLGLSVSEVTLHPAAWHCGACNTTGILDGQDCPLCRYYRYPTERPIVEQDQT